MRPEKILEELDKILDKDPGRPLYSKEKEYIEEAKKIVEWFIKTEDDGK